MKKFALALIGTFALVGFVMADEFTATIWKVDGNTITFKKGGGFGGGGFGGKKGAGTEKADPPKEEKADATADVKVAKGTFDIGAGGFGKKGAGGTEKGKGLTFTPGDPIEGGLKNEMFTKIDDQKGQFVQITRNDAGKITQILVPDFGAFGGKKAGGTGKGAGGGKKGKKGGE